MSGRPDRRPSRAMLLVVSLAVAALAPGCGSGAGEPVPGPSTPPTGPPVASAEPAPLASGEPSPGTVRVQPGVRRLTAADVFDVGSWEERTYQVAGQPAAVGVGTTVDCVGSARSFELRLGNRFKSLSLSYGQDNASQSSQETVEYSVWANGRKVDTQLLPFNAVRTARVDLRGVNALIVSAQPAPGAPCHGKTTPVVFDLLITA